MPSIHYGIVDPLYKDVVLNLIITGMPSIPSDFNQSVVDVMIVLNLIITGMPSIQFLDNFYRIYSECFKPYYNWNAFNTFKWKN